MNVVAQLCWTVVSFEHAIGQKYKDSALFKYKYNPIFFKKNPQTSGIWIDIFAILGLFYVGEVGIPW